MKKFVVRVVLLQFLLMPSARADMFGGDLVILAQILSNAVQQLVQLKNILENGKDNLDLIKDINRGINDSLNLIKTISPNTDPGLYKEWEKVSQALSELERLYGVPVESHDRKVQDDTDKSVAEAIAFNNSIYKYTKTIDDIGEIIKDQSHAVSPGGAAKLTAQALGVLIHIQNEGLRAQATGLKLQAQAMMVQNRKDKDQTRQMVATAESLQQALGTQKPKFTLPRFE
ncbi:MAG: hypothetical protein COT74_00315 [Bdellovibrionales bacterium CG10_big_fil_rev_8_21_14_0_10_45_34]|nr:MAG: hypothetical protein COT74_00315 [Bdellovibrionales bacterium CG10_big_fil_rev_8_21_14_0_10_45_34]